MKISLVMITYNEEAHVRLALENAASVVDETVVVDSLSNDRTREVAAELGARVVLHPFEDYATQRNFALEQVDNEWVLSLDADERISETLKGEILRIKAHPDPGVAGYRMCRCTYYLGRWIRHSGWYPDKKLRLFRKDQARWEGSVHERLVLTGATAELIGEIQHYSYRDLADHVARVNRYSGIQARAIVAANKRMLLLRALLLPPLTLLRHYVWRLGFLDGFPGLVVAIVSSWGTALKYLNAFCIRRETRGKPTPPSPT